MGTCPFPGGRRGVGLPRVGPLAAASAAPPGTRLAFWPSPPHGEVPEVRVFPALGRQCLQGGHGGEPGPDAHRAPPPEPHAVAAGGGQRAGRRAAGHRPDRLAEVRPRGRPVLGGWAQLWSRDHRPPRMLGGLCPPCVGRKGRAVAGRCGENPGPSLTGGPQFVCSPGRPSSVARHGAQLPPDSAQGCCWGAGAMERTAPQAPTLL